MVKSIVSVSNNLFCSLSVIVKLIYEIVENFDKQKFQAVIDFATAANGGRDIDTNLPIDNFGVIEAIE